jgi:hypothetical protein
MRSKTAMIGGAAAFAGLLLVAMPTATSAKPGDDPFVHEPVEVECNVDSVYVLLAVDTANIENDYAGYAVVSLESDIGDFAYSPGPLGWPQESAGSIYWTIPFADLGHAPITWTLQTLSEGTPLESGTVVLDFIGLCGTTETTASTTPSSSSTAPPSSEPSTTTTAPSVRAADVAAVAPVRPRVTG